MINRVLIRIKVIQLLYSIILTEKRFSIESLPTPPTKEKRFAYLLYIETLKLICNAARNLAKNNKSGGSSKITSSPFIIRLFDNEDILNQAEIDEESRLLFNRLIASVSEEIAGCKLYKDFIKGENNDKIWQEIFQSVILPNQEFNDVIAKLPNYTVGGVERFKEMMKETFKNFYATTDNMSENLNILAHSMTKARELYLRLLLLPVVITRLRAQQLDDNKHKLLAKEIDLNPNTRFIDNRMVKVLESVFQSEEIKEKNLIEKLENSMFAEDRKLLEVLLKEILSSSLYEEYLNSEEDNLKTDINLWKNIFKEIILDNEIFLDNLETKSVFWNDDLETMSTFALKTFKKCEEADKPETILLPMFKDKEDEDFGKELFLSVLQNKDQYRKIINSQILTEKWESNRLAVMDVVIMMTAIAELLNFPKIPLQVTVNEYIEIAKSYSSAKSGGFINGFLASIITGLKADGKLHK